jgi:flavin reductase (DIM6/NTAB) family NADH-FMN oxidoreductase RutF
MSLTPLNSKLDPILLRRAFGAFPSGVVAVAAEVDGVRSGMVASSFTSVSLDPALVSFSVANNSATWPLLRTSAHLGLSVLADHHDAVCRQLAGPVQHRFDGLSTTCTEDGALLLDDAVATFECSLHQEVAAGDHTMVLLALHAVKDTGTALPLVFHRSAFGRLSASA